uniref:Uncharacterized protein n=1 Tax=Cacopsylla melanoneura TaxID=428564 RepID=A0A8D8X8F8_9HEMI
MLRRPWPPVYRHPGSGGGGMGPPGGPPGPYHTFFPSFPRPNEFPRSPEFYSSPPPHKDFFHHKMSKGDYYFLAPLYRNVLPPPQPPAPLKPLPRRIMPMPPLDMRRSNSQPPCTCPVPPRLRSRSLENLTNVIVDSPEEEYPSSSNYRDSPGHHRDKENFRRSSMENLLDVNNNSSGSMMAPLFKKSARKVRKLLRFMSF